MVCQQGRCRLLVAGCLGGLSLLISGLQGPWLDLAPRPWQAAQPTSLASAVDDLLPPNATPPAAAAAGISATVATHSSPEGEGEQPQPKIKWAHPITPIIYIHVPKTGSSFMTTLAHYACGTKLNRDFVTISCGSDVRDPKPEGKNCTFHGRQQGINEMFCSTARWNDFCGNGSFISFTGGHDPMWRPDGIKVPTIPPHPLGFSYGAAFGTVPEITDSFLSRVVMMFRSPKQRLMSAWFGNKHSCKRAQDFPTFAGCVGVCQTLLGIYCGCPDKLGWGKHPELLELRVSDAISRVNLLGFVGLNKEWALTVCLFHAMFGGDCLPAEFWQGRKGGHRDTRTYHLPEYFNYTETLDDEVYSAAAAVFWRNVERYGVNTSSCAQRFCPKAAQLFLLDAG